MANIALARLESALRDRRLDRTLTSALPPLVAGAGALAPTALTPLDACLSGGLPRGQVSEITGPRSSGRTTLLLRILAAAARRGEIVALVDTLDRLDVASARAAGLDLDRLLWIRGQALTRPVGVSDLLDRTLDRALKALGLVLQAGGFGVVAIDLADVPLPDLARLPPATWLRVQRFIEGSDTACVLITPTPTARSAGGVTLSLTGRPLWAGEADRSRRLTGLGMAVGVRSPRRRMEGDAHVRGAVRG